MGLSAPRADSTEIISFQTVKKFANDYPYIFTAVNELVENRQNADMKHPQTISTGVMKQQYEHTDMYLLLIYIVKLTCNGGYILLYFFVEIKTSCVSKKTFLIHQFQL